MAVSMPALNMDQELDIGIKNYPCARMDRIFAGTNWEPTSLQGRSTWWVTCSSQCSIIDEAEDLSPPAAGG